MVSVHLSSVTVHKDNPIGVTIKGDAKVCFFLQYETTDHLGVKRATPRIDILSVGVYANGDHFSPKLFEHRRGHTVSSPMGTIENDAKTFQGQVVWKRILEKD